MLELADSDVLFSDAWAPSAALALRSEGASLLELAVPCVISAAAPALLDTTTLRSAGTSPLVLELAVSCVIWKGIQVEEER